MTVFELEQRLAELEQHNNELAATVERLRDVCGELAMSLTDSQCGFVCETRLKANEALASTPQQNLNAVKREVFISGFMADYGMSYRNATFARREAERKANTKYPSGKE